MLFLNHEAIWARSIDNTVNLDKLRVIGVVSNIVSNVARQIKRVLDLRINLTYLSVNIYILLLHNSLLRYPANMTYRCTLFGIHTLGAIEFSILDRANLRESRRFTRASSWILLTDILDLAVKTLLTWKREIYHNPMQIERGINKFGTAVDDYWKLKRRKRS